MKLDSDSDLFVLNSPHLKKNNSKKEIRKEKRNTEET
jgi:hypothetical protein